MKIGPRPLATAAVGLFLLSALGLLVVEDGAAGTQLTTAAAATTAKGTARMATSFSFGTGGSTTTMSGEGLLDMGKNLARVTFTSSVVPAPMDVIVDGTTVYVATVAPELKAQAGGKPWVAFDSSGSVPGLGGGAFSGAADPMQSLNLLDEKGIARDVRQNGTEDVRGVRTTRYVAVLDMAKMVEGLDSPQAEAVGRLIRDAEAEMEIWTDEEELVRRAAFRMTYGATGATFSTTVTTEFFDFGVAVDVSAPPADQVHRLPVPGSGTPRP